MAEPGESGLHDSADVGLLRRVTHHREGRRAAPGNHGCERVPTACHQAERHLLLGQQLCRRGPNAGARPGDYHDLAHNTSRKSVTAYLIIITRLYGAATHVLAASAAPPGAEFPEMRVHRRLDCQASTGDDIEHCEQQKREYRHNWHLQPPDVSLLTEQQG